MTVAHTIATSLPAVGRVRKQRPRRLQSATRRSFRSTDRIADSSRKLACRRAGVSVVSPVFSVRRDRRSASDPSIARRSRSSISSFKCPRPSAMFGLRGNQICDIARGGLFGRANLLHSRANMRWTFVGVACARRLASYGCRKRLRRAGHGGRTSSPASESMVERGRSLVAQQPGNLRKGHTGLLEILERQSAPQLVYDLLVGRSLDIEPARKRSHAHAERLCDGSLLRLAMRQEFFRLFLDRGAQRIRRGPALLGRHVAKGLKRFEQLPVGCEEWGRDRGV